MTGAIAPLPAATADGREGLDFLLSARVTRGWAPRDTTRSESTPFYRPLRIFTVDPTSGVSEAALATIRVPYEKLAPGPAGARLVIEDGALYGGVPIPPLDLDDAGVLLEQGCTPTTTDPRFRAQMAYAVCSSTITLFRHALGREVPWGFASRDAGEAKLRVRCCVDGVRNAYYDASRGELRLGAFDVDAAAAAAPASLGRNPPSGRVYTALLHDVLAHETTHALLDGLRAHTLIPSNPDVLAFHEAFADIVALLQRFTYHDVVRAGLRETRGAVTHAELLTGLGRQFAQTSGLGDALRDAEPREKLFYDTTLEPHARGAVLLAAVFRAFATTYRRKTRPLLRLATGGSGVLPAGEISEGLLTILTDEACDLAGQFLAMCIRAIDYCPPVDITFGEYLRAVITADFEVMRDDSRWGYREAWVDAFRFFGIYPADVPSLEVAALRWRTPDAPLPPSAELAYSRLRFGDAPGLPASGSELRRQASALGALVGDVRNRGTFGLACNGDPALGADSVEAPMVESICSARRAGPDGQLGYALVAEVCQRRRVAAVDGQAGFDFYGGATVILDHHGAVRYTVRKSVLNADRLARQRAFMAQEVDGARQWTRFGDRSYPATQPFRALHAFRGA